MTETTTDIIRSELTPLIARLNDPATPVEFIAETMNRVEFMVEMAREFLEAAKAALGERIRECGPVEYGDVLWVLSEAKETKCIDKPGTLALLLEMFPPDQVARDFLAAQPFKHGSIRKALDDPATYDRLFQIEFREGVKKEVRKLNKRFLEGQVSA